MSLLDAYGIDKEDFVWQDLALCSKYEHLHVNDFYENYTNSVYLAMQIDQMCLSCPVAKECSKAGRENNDYGVWGGVYLTNGKVDKEANKHKTKEVWEELEDIL